MCSILLKTRSNNDIITINIKTNDKTITNVKEYTYEYTKFNQYFYQDYYKILSE